MNKKILLILPVLAAIIILGGLLYVKNKRNTQIIKTQETIENQKQNKDPNQIEEKTSIMENWKTYRDEKYGFEIKYNPAWRIKEVRNNEKGKDGLFILVDGNYSVNMGAESALSKESPKEWLNRKIFAMKAEKRSERNYSINNNSAYYSEIVFNKGNIEYDYVISNGKALINFYYIGSPTNQNSEIETTKDIDFTKYQADFEMMINSITFFEYDKKDSNFTYYKIPELGVQFKTSKGFADNFKYSFENAINKNTMEKINIAHFSCGALVRSSKPKVEYDSNYFEGSEFSRKIGTFYLIYQPHHAYDLQNDNCYDMNVRISFEDLLNNLELL